MRTCLLVRTLVFMQATTSMENAPLVLLLLLISPTTEASTQDRRRRFIDGIIHTAALESYPKHHKTAVPYDVPVPPSLSSRGASARAVKFRAGRFRRHGAVIDEFHLFPGLVVHPHPKRLLVVRQNLGNLSASLSSLPGYRLVSPVLGLLIYDAAAGTSSAELELNITKEPIAMDFSRVAGEKEEAVCVMFGLGGLVEISGPRAGAWGGEVCKVRRQGHFGLVVERRVGDEEEGVRRWKLVVATAAAGAAGAALLGMVVVAVVKGKRKEWRAADMERRAYEDEALRVSMVGNVRTPTAAAVLTVPVIETEYGPPLL